MSPEDQTVVAALLAGDEATFAALVERLHPRLVRVSRRFVATDAAAEDVAQDTWQAVLQGLCGFEGRSGLDTWVLQIAINRARTRGASDARVESLEDEGAELNERFTWYGGWREAPRSCAVDCTPETVAANKELALMLITALDRLPEQQRLVVALRDVEWLTSAEVCQLLEISEENQRVLLHRGRARLRMLLEGSLGEAPAAATGT